MRNKLPMKKFVLNLLRSNLPPNYFYHNPEHTIYVHEKAMEIGRFEGCTEEELKLLSIAALWHDTGLTKVYKHHEDESCVMARKYLSENGYLIEDIDRICCIIMATQLPQQPQDKLGEIIADADLEYLGTACFETVSNTLFKELQSMNPSLTRACWNQMQISFLQKHKYFTRFCKENREPLKQIYLNKLLQVLE